MTIFELFDEVSNCNYRKQGGEITENEICEFWLITQKLSQNSNDFEAKLYPKDTGRVGNMNSPYTLVTCSRKATLVYIVERLDEHMVKDRPRKRTGAEVLIPVADGTQYEKAFTAIIKLNLSPAFEFINVKDRRIMQVWFDI
jgi:hypothetical protein